jgi:hypothetical protein
MNLPTVVSEFAQADIDEDFAKAYAFTTTGLQARIDLGGFIQALEDAEADVVPPRRFDLDGNTLIFHQPSETQVQMRKSFPPDIDPASFQKWMCIQFQPGEIDDSDLDA